MRSLVWLDFKSRILESKCSYEDNEWAYQENACAYPSFVAHANPAMTCKYQTRAQEQWHISINTHPLDSPERNWTWELTVIRPFHCWTWWLVCVREDNITTKWNKPEGENPLHWLLFSLLLPKSKRNLILLFINYFYIEWLPMFC